MDPQEIDLAREIHYGFLPDDYTDDVFEVAAHVLPHDKIGGDYCTIYPMDERRLLICACDAVGHGIAAALLAARINTYVLTHAGSCAHPCDLVERLNQFLCERLADLGMLASFFATIVDAVSMSLGFAGAGHPPALLFRRATGDVTRLGSQTTPLGVSHPLPIACAVGDVSLAPGDRLFLYTDGLVEARGADGELFGLERTERSLQDSALLGSAAINAALLEEVTQFTGGRFDDDVLALTLAVRDGDAPGAGTA